jgi:hypothetical protein
MLQTLAGTFHPSCLFVLALILAAVLGPVECACAPARSQDAAHSTPLYLLVGAWLLLGLRGGSWIPSGGMFA